MATLVKEVTPLVYISYSYNPPASPFSCFHVVNIKWKYLCISTAELYLLFSNINYCRSSSPQPCNNLLVLSFFFFPYPSYFLPWYHQPLPSQHNLLLLCSCSSFTTTIPSSQFLLIHLLLLPPLYTPLHTVANSFILLAYPTCSLIPSPFCSPPLYKAKVPAYLWLEMQWLSCDWQMEKAAACLQTVLLHRDEWIET